MSHDPDVSQDVMSRGNTVVASINTNDIFLIWLHDQIQQAYLKMLLVIALDPAVRILSYIHAHKPRRRKWGSLATARCWLFHPELPTALN